MPLLLLITMVPNPQTSYNINLISIDYGTLANGWGAYRGDGPQYASGRNI